MGLSPGNTIVLTKTGGGRKKIVYCKIGRKPSTRIVSVLKSKFSNGRVRMTMQMVIAAYAWFVSAPIIKMSQDHFLDIHSSRLSKKSSHSSSVAAPIGAWQVSCRKAAKMSRFLSANVSSSIRSFDFNPCIFCDSICTNFVFAFRFRFFRTGARDTSVLGALRFAINNTEKLGFLQASDLWWPTTPSSSVYNYLIVIECQNLVITW